MSGGTDGGWHHKDEKYWRGPTLNLIDYIVKIIKRGYKWLSGS